MGGEGETQGERWATAQCATDAADLCLEVLEHASVARGEVVEVPAGPSVVGVCEHLLAGPRLDAGRLRLLAWEPRAVLTRRGGVGWGGVGWGGVGGEGQAATPFTYIQAATATPSVYSPFTYIDERTLSVSKSLPYSTSNFFIPVSTVSQ